MEMSLIWKRRKELAVKGTDQYDKGKGELTNLRDVFNREKVGTIYVVNRRNTN